ncbi:uncharacterized protein LMH87_009077 [Akanthomyces muscarius]|uniref:Uncharacterized protein n=1 Tax=Akanthomyces muscarius TaxID=2231603 RepID=A0A9W8UML4_AKAMU|nr:uncharacterized protein LMH87_009077 [Akanthomyces muscarius]KAJ4158555.1 hypothetical protein LMH87_009077 [Akanthomyces muscarius]
MTKLAGTFVPRAPLSVNGPFIDGPFFAAWRVFSTQLEENKGDQMNRWSPMGAEVNHHGNPSTYSADRKKPPFPRS